MTSEHAMAQDKASTAPGSSPAPQRSAGAGLWGADLLVFESLSSTQAWALANAATCRHGDVVRALRQTAGRGRFDRTWISPARSCLTFSVVLRPADNTGFPFSLALSATALAVAQALEAFKLHPRLKWPNDVLVGDRKIAGMLAEIDQATRAMILGVGLNVNLTAPALAGMTLAQPATSMAVERERLFDVAAVGAEVLRRLEPALDRLVAQGPGPLLDAWKPLDALEGRDITLQTPSGPVLGKYAGTKENGQLRLRDSLGQERLFWSGDVSVRG